MSDQTKPRPKEVVVLVTLGPLSQPNERFQAVPIEILDNRFYKVRRVGSNEVLTVHEHQITFPREEHKNATPIVIEPSA